MTDEPILVVGASGAFGGAMVAEALRRERWVRALARDPARVRARFGSPAGLEVMTGDVQQPESLERAAAGCGIIVHGVNYPYPQWQPHMRTATANIIAAAERERATIVFPGNVYGLGRQTATPLTEAAAMQPCSVKGQLRLALETDLAAAAARGARCLIVRAGDYYGPWVRNGLVDRLFASAAAAKPLTALGRLTVPHQWAYVPDLARLTLDLLDRGPALAPHELVHFAGHVATPAGSFPRRIAELAGHPTLKIRVLPWWLLRLAGRLNPMIGELLELRYLFDEAVILAERRRLELLPDWQATPLDQAIAATLASYRSPLEH